MKNHFYFLWSMLLIGMLLGSTSCKDDEGGDPPLGAAPTLAVSGAPDPTTTTANVGENIDFSVIVTAPEGFSSLQISKKLGTTGGTTTFDEHTHTGAVTTTYTYPFSYAPQQEEAGQQLIFDFVALDKTGRQGSYQYIIAVNEASDPNPDPDPDPEPEPELVTYSALRLYPAAPDTSSATWFNAFSGEVVTGRAARDAAVAEAIDFGYYYGTNLNATLASPDFYPKADFGQAAWARRNETKLKNTTLSPEEFANISTVAELEEIFATALSYEEGDPHTTFYQNRVFQLQPNKVVVFKTDANRPGGSRYGLALVSDIVGTAGRSDYVVLDVKVALSGE